MKLGTGSKEMALCLRQEAKDNEPMPSASKASTARAARQAGSPHVGDDARLRDTLATVAQAVGHIETLLTLLYCAVTGRAAPVWERSPDEVRPPEEESPAAHAGHGRPYPEAGCRLTVEAGEEGREESPVAVTRDLLGV